MAGRRGCVTSLWSGSERVRIGERLKASLAGIMELDLLRCRHWEMVEAVLGRRVTDDVSISQRRGTGEATTIDGLSRSRRQQVLSPSKSMLPCLDGGGTGAESCWSTLSWDIPSDPLSTPTPDSSCAAQLECDSRPSSGFYSVSGSSLSDSCCSVCSEGAQGASSGCVGIRNSCFGWDLRPHSADHSASQWQEASKTPGQNAQVLTERGERRPFSTGDLEVSGLLFLSTICSALGEDPSQSLPITSLLPRLQLDPRFCTDLVSRKTKEVYPYPSPLHAVALQSPLFTSCEEQTLQQNPQTSSEGAHDSDGRPEAPPAPRLPPFPSVAQLDQYISKLVLRYHSRSTVEPSSRAGSRKWHTGPGHGSSQSLASFDGTVPTGMTGGVAQRRSLYGSSGGSCRNSINLGNLPSLNGDNMNLNFQMNLNLHLNPNLNVNTSLSMDSKERKGSTGSSDYLGNETPTPTPSPSSSSSMSASSALRARKRISTCPQTVNHRSSLEIKGLGFGPQGFSRSLDWSGISQEEVELSPARVHESSPKISEDSARVCEIARVSGLPRSVVAGLLEEGVELDADCFRNEADRDEPCSIFTGRPNSPVSTMATFPNSTPPGDAPCHSEQPSSWWSAPMQYHSPPIPEIQPDSQHPPPSPAGTDSSLDARPHSRGQQTHSPSHFDCHPSVLAPQKSPSPRSSPSEVQVPRFPPRPLLAPHSLSVFQRSSPTQSSLPRLRTNCPPPEGDLRPRGGSLRQEVGWSSAGRVQRGAEGESLYRGRHTSQELVRASTVSSYSGREDPTEWEETKVEGGGGTPKRGSSFRKRLEGLFGGKEKDKCSGREREQARWKEQTMKSEGWTGMSGQGDHISKHRAPGTPPVGVLYRSGSQGFLATRPQKREGRERRQQWVSSLEIARAGLGRSSMGLSLEQGRALAVGTEDERLSSTASLFHLSRSQSPEGSCLSLSPLSSPSLSPPPPPPPRLTRSRSFRDLGRRVFSSVKPFSFKTQSLRK